MKHLIILIAFLISTFGLQAQDDIFPYWNKIDLVDLESSTYEQDTSAAAVYLVNYGKARFKIYKEASCFMYDYHYQIKILKKSAFDLADISFTQGTYYKIENLEAVVHNFVNGKKVSTIVTDIKEEKISKYRKRISFACPEVRVGSIIEYKYTIPRPYSVTPRNFYFQKSYPVKMSEYCFVFLSNNDYQMIKPNIDIKEEGDSMYIYYPKGYEPIGLATHWWRLRNIPGLPSEPFVKNIGDYRFRMKMQLTAYRDLETGEPTDVLSTWEELAKRYRGTESLKDVYNKRSLRSVVKELETFNINEKDDSEKLKILYEFVQNNIEWDEYYGLYLDNSFKKLLKNGEGESGDINLLLLALLNYYNISANPVLISTQDNSRIIKNYPFIGQFNHVIIEAEIDGEKIYLDAIDPAYSFDILPENSICNDGFIIREKTEEWIKIPIKKAEEVSILNLSINESGVLSGDLNQQHKHYSAFDIREKIANSSEAKYKANIFKEIGDIKINNFTQKNLYENIDKPVITTLEFEATDETQLNGNFIYLNPFLGLGELKNPFTAETRRLPVELPFPKQTQIIINLKIPEGYTIEEIPKNVNYQLDNGNGKFLFVIKQFDDSIQILSKVSLYESYFEVNTYGFLKEFFDLIIQKQNSQIVFKKK